MTALPREATMRRASYAATPPLTRSPIHAFTLVIGVLVTGAGWAAATLLDRTILGVDNDLDGARDLLPGWASSAAEYVAALGTIAVVVGLHTWLLANRRLRELAVVYAGAIAAAIASILVGDLLESVLDPALRATTREPTLVTRGSPTDPGVAAVFAALVLIRRWIAPRARLVIYGAIPFWLLIGSLAVGGTPYAGVLVDIGLGMIAGSVAGLVLRTPSIRPGPGHIRRAFAEVGVPIVELSPADVDARGSTPFLAQTGDGRRIFVKALSTEQRSADLLFRGARWLRLRRSGDAPPEISLRRAAEHEAFVSHHARAIGIPTPALVAVADLGDDNVALAYEAVMGRSLDRVAPSEVTDAQLIECWRSLALMQSNGVAHRDLRLANLFLTDEGTILLIDFGFGEVAASRQLLDTDTAELLASLGSWLGVERSLRTAIQGLGADAVAAAGEWLHPMALSGATRAAVGHTPLLDDLRLALQRIVGHDIPQPEPMHRFAVQRLVVVASTVLGLMLLAALIHDDTVDRLASANLTAVAGAVAIGAMAPIAAGSALRAASAGRLRTPAAIEAVMIGALPGPAPTPWSWMARAVTERSVEAGIWPQSCRRIVAHWIITGIVAVPIMVGVITVAGLRPSRGSLSATGVAAVLAGVLVIVQVGLLRLAPWARSLDREWLRAFEPTDVVRATGRAAVVFGWWSVHLLCLGLPLVLMAEAFAVESAPELLLVVGMLGPAFSSLSPVRGGLGATEVLLGAGLAFDTTIADAALVVVATRVTTHWVLLLVGLFLWRRRAHHTPSASTAEEGH